MEIITSSQNKFIKLAASLKQKKYRDEVGSFLVEGVRLVEEAVRSDWPVEICICNEESTKNQRVQEILASAQLKHCRVIQVSDAIYSKLTDTKEPQGLMAIMKKKLCPLEDMLEAEENGFFILLDNVQDPGNVGTMIRTAAAAGCSGVILTKGCADVFGTKAVRASMGSVFYVPIVEGLTSSEIISRLGQHGTSIFATSLESSKVYSAVDFKPSVAIVFGNEGNGVSREFLEKAQERLYIPLANHVESLNVAASAAVILYEVVRQRF